MNTHHLRLGKAALASAWLEARQRIVLLGSGHRDAFSRLADLVDFGATEIQKLQELFDRDPLAVQRRDPWSQILNFIDGDITDLMRGVSIDVANLVPGEQWLDVADPVEAEGDVELLARYLRVAVLAAAHPDVPADGREVLRQVGAAMEGWGEQVVACIGEVSRDIVDPACALPLAS